RPASALVDPGSASARAGVGGTLSLPRGPSALLLLCPRIRALWVDASWPLIPSCFEISHIPFCPSPACAVNDMWGRLLSAGTDVDLGGVRPHRVDEGCAGKEDIAIYQGRGTKLPSGVPAYTVDVMNRCSGGNGDCAIAGIHVRCGWFSSVSLVDPRKFRRLARDDCLLNDGQPLLAGETISFEYSNSFPYQLSVAVATCVDPAAATSP
uniref:Uncharacterized protein n=1 Tax=Aegilops tauschii subsp. strangulata TaxID=200361 RepID=A0A452Y508_AEGTS